MIKSSVSGQKSVSNTISKFVLAIERKRQPMVQEAVDTLISLARKNALSTPSKASGRTGARKQIARAIDVRWTALKNAPEVIGRVGVFYAKGSGRARIAHLIEYGFRLTHYFGTKISSRKIPEKPFMRPAFNKVKAQYDSIVSAYMKDYL